MSTAYNSQLGALLGQEILIQRRLVTAAYIAALDPANPPNAGQIEALKQAVSASEGEAIVLHLREEVSVDPSAGSGLAREITTLVRQMSTDSTPVPLALWLKIGSADTAWLNLGTGGGVQFQEVTSNPSLSPGLDLPITTIVKLVDTATPPNPLALFLKVGSATTEWVDLGLIEPSGVVNAYEVDFTALPTQVISNGANLIDGHSWTASNMAAMQVSSIIHGQGLSLTSGTDSAQILGSIRAGGLLTVPLSAFSSAIRMGNVSEVWLWVATSQPGQTVASDTYNAASVVALESNPYNGSAYTRVGGGFNCFGVSPWSQFVTGQTNEAGTEEIFPWTGHTLAVGYNMYAVRLLSSGLAEVYLGNMLSGGTFPDRSTLTLFFTLRLGLANGIPASGWTSAFNEGLGILLGCSHSATVHEAQMATVFKRLRVEYVPVGAGGAGSSYSGGTVSGRIQTAYQTIATVSGALTMGTSNAAFVTGTEDLLYVCTTGWSPGAEITVKVQAARRLVPNGASPPSACAPITCAGAYALTAKSRFRLKLAEDSSTWDVFGEPFIP